MCVTVLSDIGLVGCWWLIYLSKAHVWNGIGILNIGLFAAVVGVQ